MKNDELLEMLLAEPMKADLKNELVKGLFLDSRRESNGIVHLTYCPNKLNYEEIYERMKLVGGGTGASIAKILGITPQGVNNQTAKGIISGNTLLKFSIKTKISLDWLIGTRAGNSSNPIVAANICDVNAVVTIDDPAQKYLLLVETYDQQNGNVELKWCLIKEHIFHDDNMHRIRGDFNALYSLIMRYRVDAGTNERVKNGGRRHYQVRKVLAYVLGDPKIISDLDSKAKKNTAGYKSGDIDRPGKTEFRLLSAKEKCLQVFSDLVKQNGLKLIKPEFDYIAWDYLVGPGSMTPRDWVVNKFRESMNPHRPEWGTKDEFIAGLHIPTESIPIVAPLWCVFRPKPSTIPA